MTHEADLTRLAFLIVHLGRKVSLYRPQDPALTQLTMLESLVIQYLERNAGATPSQLSAGLGLKSSNTAVLVRSLEGKGLLHKRPDSTDRRQVRLHLSALAVETIAQVNAEMVAFLDPLVSDGQDLPAAVRLLSELDEKWNESNPQPGTASQ